MNEERRIYNPATAPPWNPHKEWVELSDGSFICVWELSVPESLSVGEAGMRHPQDPRPGPDNRELSLWLIAYSCRAGDAPDSPRIWSDLQVHLIMALPPADFAKLLLAARGLQEDSEEAEERLRDFTPPTPAGPSPVLPTGVSRNSTGSPESSPASEWASLPER